MVCFMSGWLRPLTTLSSHDELVAKVADNKGVLQPWGNLESYGVLRSPTESCASGRPRSISMLGRWLLAEPQFAGQFHEPRFHAQLLPSLWN